MLQELVPELELEVSPILAVRATRVFALAGAHPHHRAEGAGRRFLGEGSQMEQLGLKQCKPPFEPRCALRPSVGPSCR
eukprot:CAMPEP_0182559772 /NCGR_PEP_ID=MMETSP1324-20130603/2774_1 /TAXON_ID=236786 /ORGANISM="Florenciella sp., Strain RCC1587" /LENGTH=77 /DNA_ID=CAMNT_0024772075 /DNA_START=720 /DNA_END=950 /DNA_ORIENTATION=+